jgi:hypothetical protein
LESGIWRFFMTIENNEIKIATNIDTKIFYSIFLYLKNDRWKILIEYSDLLFDKGIDFDFYELGKENDRLQFAWSNWFEGEIKGDIHLLNEFSRFFNITFEYNNPEYLNRPNLINELKPLLTFK